MIKMDYTYLIGQQVLNYYSKETKQIITLYNAKVTDVFDDGRLVVGYSQTANDKPTITETFDLSQVTIGTISS